MPVRHEVKSQLAKLLATEDLIVEQKKVETASFNTHTRVLTLPMWNASSDVYDMLVCHEVGHALYTPDKDTPRSIPRQFINVTEDARIEKMMKRRYAGVFKTFKRGYDQLAEDDFFELEDVDISKMNLADRANLWFKIGAFIDIPIERGEEMDIINQIADAETFEDAVEAANVLYAYCKKPKTESPTQNPQQQSQQGQPGESENTDDSESEQQESKEAADDIDPDADLDTPSYEQEKSEEEPEVQTDAILSEKLSEMINQNANQSHYFEISDINLDEMIIDVNEVQRQVSHHFSHFPNTDFDWPDSQYINFKRSANKEVNYLVKEFECRKSADSYARASVSRTGVLDTTKLHTYRYNEDLFKKVTTLADGKNHGLIFMLDWSGSMADIMIPTLKQLFNLVWFCKKVQIPFDVYAFSNSCRGGKSGVCKLEEGKLYVEGDNRLIHFLSSDLKTKQLDLAMKDMWRIAWSFRTYLNYTVPYGFGLSGTPLNESIIALHKILPAFKKKTNVDKMHTIVLTDGEANTVPFGYDYGFPDGQIRTLYPKTNDFLRDRKLGTTYKLGYDYSDFTKILLDNLRDKFPESSFIGIRILETRDSGRFLRYHNANMDQWKKQRTVTLKGAGYNAYFVLANNTLNTNSELDVKDDASKADIRKAFTKSLSSKKMNKKVLNEFVALIA